MTDPETARARHRSDADDWFQALSRPEGWWARWGDQAGEDDAHSPAVADHLALLL